LETTALKADHLPKCKSDYLLQEFSIAREKRTTYGILSFMKILRREWGGGEKKGTKIKLKREKHSL
jgi:hypothetical protein